MRCFQLLLVATMALAVAGCRREDNPVSDGPGWQLQAPAADATPVIATGPRPGIYPVGSRVPDAEAPGGFAPCENYPLDVDGKKWGQDGAVALVAFADEPVAYFKHAGMAVRLINRTDLDVAFPACDSCLLLVQDAQDEAGRWRAIESSPQPICYRSYHRVTLPPQQYWQFPARVYGGSMKTKMRFRLEGEGGQVLYSNEFDGAISRGQFVAQPDRQ